LALHFLGDALLRAQGVCLSSLLFVAHFLKAQLLCLLRLLCLLPLLSLLPQLASLGDSLRQAFERALIWWSSRGGFGGLRWLRRWPGLASPNQMTVDSFRVAEAFRNPVQARGRRLHR